MNHSELLSSPSDSRLTLSRMLANQWVETLRQSACLEVLLHSQARLIGTQSKQDPESVLQELNAQVAASLERLVAIYGTTPAAAAAELLEAVTAETVESDTLQA